MLLFKMLKIQFYTCLNHCKSVHRTYKPPSAHPFIRFPNTNAFCYLRTDTECHVCKSFTHNSTSIQSFSRATEYHRRAGTSRVPQTPVPCPQRHR